MLKESTEGKERLKTNTEEICTESKGKLKTNIERFSQGKEIKTENQY